jgi:glycosyltransferase involved in cell wall biosynthesis
MIRVLILNPYLPTFGGGEKHMGYLCKFIENYYKDVSIDILVHNYNNVDIHSEDYPTIEKLNERFGLELKKTTILKFDLPKAMTLQDHFRNKRRIEEVTKKYDLFINFMFFSKHEGKAKRNIYVCMFPPKKYEFDSLAKKVAGKYLDYRFKKSYSHFITNSYFTNHWMEFIWRTGKKNRMIYPPVFSNSIIEERKSISEERKNIILSVGRFFVGAHNKKQDYLLEFFIKNEDRFANWEFHLVGAVSTAEQDIKYLENLKELASGKKNVHFHVNCTYQELEELYRNAKIFWHATGFGENDNEFPEKMEHFGITTAEAMSYGVVPVVINKGGQTEIVENGVSGYLWSNEEELLQHTVKLISDESLLKEMSTQCFARATHFTIEKFFARNKEIFDELSI